MLSCGYFRKVDLLKYEKADKMNIIKQVWIESAIEDLSLHRHWSQSSELFTGSDALVWALDTNWRIIGGVSRHEFALSGGRQTRVYQFLLERDFDLVTMRVIENPYVINLIRQFGLRVQIQLHSSGH
jgi:hypothetical protein